MIKMWIGERPCNPTSKNALTITSEEQNVPCVHIWKKVLLRDAVEAPEVELIA